MAKGYYPDFYLRKRKRDQKLLVVRNSVISVVVIAVAVGLGFFVYKSYLEPRKQLPGATAELAEQRDRMETESALNSDPAVPESKQDNYVLGQTDLTKLEYNPSFAGIQVSIEQGDSAGANSGETADTEEPIVSSGSIEDLGAEAASPTPVTESSAAANSSAGSTSSQQGGRDQTSGNSAGNQQSSQSGQADSNPPATEHEEAAAPSETAQPPAENAGATQTETFIYRVYGGQTNSRESAEKLKSDLGTIGLTGSIIKNGGEYLVFVSEFSDFSAAFSLTNQLQNGGFQAAFVSKVEQH